VVNLNKLNIKTNNETKKINPKEKKVLETMLEYPGKIFSRDDIGKILNISKRLFSHLLLSKTDTYTGPVIVKTNANYGAPRVHLLK
jgi:predicted P-loop ATPase/GTPase